MTLEQAIMQQYQTNTVQNTRSAGAHPQPPPQPQPQPQPPPQPQPQPQPGYSGYPPEGAEGSRCLGNDRGTSGSVLPQPPHQMTYGQPPQPVGQPPTAQGPHGVGGYGRGVFALLPLEAGVVANQQQRDDRFHPAHEKLHQAYARQGRTAYENVALAARGGDQRQHVAGHGGYSTGGGAKPPNLPQMHPWADPYLQRSGQPQGVRHAYYPGQVPPGPAYAPVHEPPPDATLYENFPGSESAIYQNAGDLLQCEANSERNLENITVTQEVRKLFQQYPELAGLPPQQKDTEHSSQPPGRQLGVGMPPKAQSVDKETQQRKEIQRQNPVDRFSSGNLEAAAATLAHTSQASPSPAYAPKSPPTQKSSCDLPPNAPVMGVSPLAAAKLKQRDGLSNNPPSVDEVEQEGERGGRKHHGMRTSVSGSDLIKYECHSQSSEPSSPRRLDKPIPRPRRSRSPSPLSSTENSPSTSPTPERRKMSPVPEHSSQPPGPQLGVGMPPKAQSVDTETQRRKEIQRQNPVDRFSSGNLEAAAAALAHTSQASPSPAYVTKSPPTQKSSCDLPPNAPVMGISPQAADAVSTNTAAAETIDTSETDQSDLDQRRPNRQSIESLEKNLGQDNSKLRRQEPGKQPVRRSRSSAISESSNPHRKSSQLNNSDEDGESDDNTTATDADPVPYSLGETWVCSYCTNLVQATLHKCEVCGHEKLEITV